MFNFVWDTEVGSKELGFNDGTASIADVNLAVHMRYWLLTMWLLFCAQWLLDSVGCVLFTCVKFSLV